jgi:hypothetical protein
MKQNTKSDPQFQNDRKGLKMPIKYTCIYPGCHEYAQTLSVTHQKKRWHVVKVQGMVITVYPIYSFVWIFSRN